MVEGDPARWRLGPRNRPALHALGSLKGAKTSATMRNYARLQRGMGRRASSVSGDERTGVPSADPGVRDARRTRVPSAVVGVACFADVEDRAGVRSRYSAGGSCRR